MVRKKPFSTTPKEVTAAEPLDSFRMGSDWQGNQPCDQRVGTLRPTPQPARRGERLESECITNCQ